MKLFARKFIFLAILFAIALGFQARATQVDVSPVREALDAFFLEWDRSATREKEAEAASHFIAELDRLASQGYSRESVIEEMRSIVLDHQTEAELDHLLLAVNAGVLTPQEISSGLVDIAIRCQATGAYFVGDPKRSLRATSAIQVVLIYMLGAAGAGAVSR